MQKCRHSAPPVKEWYSIAALDRTRGRGITNMHLVRFHTLWGKAHEGYDVGQHPALVGRGWPHDPHFKSDSHWEIKPWWHRRKNKAR